MKSILKIVFLAIVGFGILVYLTAPENKTNNVASKNDDNIQLSIDLIPRFFEVVGKSEYTKFETLFQKDVEKHIIVLNHDALVVFKDLYKKTDKSIVLIANISNTPWLVKKLAVNDELEKMYKDSTIPLINDNSGSFTKILSINSTKQNQYFVYKLNTDGKITKITEGFVKEGALEKGLTNKELENNLNDLIKILQ
ncbi:MAG: hypothetical protein KA055_00415 [Aliarcobacter sp.]|nr:hypothetical protein [Aliarcobacter sp.]